MTSKLYNELIEKEYTPVTEVPDNADTVLLYFKNLSTLNRKLFVSNVFKDDQHTFDNQNQTININNITNTATFCLKEYVKPEINCDDATDNSVQLEADGIFDLVINGKVVESNKTIKELCDIYNLSSTNDLLILADQTNKPTHSDKDTSNNTDSTFIDNTCYFSIYLEDLTTILGEKVEDEDSEVNPTFTVTLQEVSTKDTCSFDIILNENSLFEDIEVAKGTDYFVVASLFYSDKYVHVLLKSYIPHDTDNLLTVSSPEFNNNKIHILPNTNTSLKLLNNDKVLSFKMTSKQKEKD